MSAELCPVCSGTGKYRPPGDASCTALPMLRPCHGCGGQGWVATDTNPGIFASEGNDL